MPHNAVQFFESAAQFPNFFSAKFQKDCHVDAVVDQLM